MDTTEAPVIPSVPSLPTVQSTRGLFPRSAGVVSHCVVCCEPVARWRFKHARYGTHEVDLCSLCFLYKSGWLVAERVRRVEQVCQAISRRRGELAQQLEFAMSPQGDRQWPPRLVNIKDADDVLGAIVLHDRFEIVLSEKKAQRVS